MCATYDGVWRPVAPTSDLSRRERRRTRRRSRRLRLSEWRGRQRHKIPLGIGDKPDAFAPWHVGWLAHHVGASLAQLSECAIDVIDVDEQLMSRSWPGLDPRQHPRRVFRRHGQFRAIAPEPDEPNSTIWTWQPEMLLKPETQVEFGDTRHVFGVEDRERSKGHSRSVADLERSGKRAPHII